MLLGNNYFCYGGIYRQFQQLIDYIIVDQGYILNHGGTILGQYTPQDIYNYIQNLYQSQWKEYYIVIYQAYDYTYTNSQIPLTNAPILGYYIYQSEYISVTSPLSEQYQYISPVLEPLVSDQDYLQSISAIQEYIKAGDIYLANLSRPFRLEYQSDIVHELLFWELYSRHLAPYASYLQLSSCDHIISQSPECYYQIHNNQIYIYPIKGTATLHDHSLITDIKEQAEHLMLVDLMRNDLGRICLPDTIKVQEYAKVQQYTYVQHLVSAIQGIIQDQYILPWNLLSSEFFPGGSITGTPKLNCMRILANIEPYRRLAYTGTLGYILPTGEQCFNILIRTLYMKDHIAYLHTGGGIVYDSDPEHELEETYLKTQGFVI